MSDLNYDFAVDRRVRTGLRTSVAYSDADVRGAISFYGTTD